MTTDIYPVVLFNDGEEAVINDMNTTVRSILAQMYDRVQRARIPAVPNTIALQNVDYANTFDATTSPYALALTGAAAMPVQGSANNKVKISKGTIFQALASETGAEAQLLPFTFDGTVEVSIANGDPANPRVDIIQVALSYVDDTPTSIAYQPTVGAGLVAQTVSKRHRVQCVVSVKQGAAAASPTYPTADAGNVILAGVVVGTNYVAAAGLKNEDTAGAVAVLHDQRVPLGVHCPVASPATFGGALTNWTVSSRDALVASGAAADLLVPCPTQGIARLLAISVLIKDPAALTTRMIKYGVGDNGGGGTQITNTALNNANVGGSGSGSNALRASFMTSMGHTPAAGPTVLASAAGVGAPLWTSGRRTPFDTIANAVFPQTYESLGFRITAAVINTVLGPVTFFLAGEA